MELWHVIFVVLKETGKYAQRAESFIGICCEKIEWKWLFKRSALFSGFMTVMPFFFSVLVPAESVFFV